MSNRRHHLLYPSIIALFFLMTVSVNAVFVEDRLADPALEARAQEIAEGIRCLVCQNQSIMDSNADLAKDLRGIVRERILAGDTDDEVEHFLVSRYGDWVLLKPPFRLRTYLLWFGPLLVFLGGGYAMFLFLRRKNDRRNTELGVTPLSAEEQAELDKILASNEEGRQS